MSDHYDELFIKYYNPLPDYINLDLNKKIAQLNIYNSNIQNINSYIDYLSKHHTFKTEENLTKRVVMEAKRKLLYENITAKLGAHPETFEDMLKKNYVILSDADRADPFFKKYRKYKNKYMSLKKKSQQK